MLSSNANTHWHFTNDNAEWHVSICKMRHHLSRVLGKGKDNAGLPRRRLLFFFTPCGQHFGSQDRLHNNRICVITNADYNI